ncbi:glycosyltransferase family 87 protein [Bradyrhizobium sp.]|uniref:glycosyltransferase family 87 protein n=1 Tax=Bradyrhizobium sp. TaxID=376 RepID=UPI0025C0E663|nr:glycosyltransferase family 87 protein [Bradyrhizobium sp.]
MPMAVSCPTSPGAQSAIPPALLNVCFVLCVINAAYFPVAYFSQRWIYDPAGLGIPTDFINVWAAGRLVLDGVPAQAYDWDIQKQVEVALLGRDFTGYFAWHYPPPFLFVASLLAHFPYTVAFIGWVSVSLLPYLAVMRAIVGRGFGLLLAIGFPVVFSNTLVGQNGFLTAALIGGTLYLMPVRPALAGICLGLLSYKPQYGLLFPLVLIAASQWTVFFTAAIVAVAMAFASWLAFGTESWQAFFHWMPTFSQAFLTEGKATWWKLQSLFSLVRYFGGSEATAWGFHWVLTASVATGLVVMWRSRVSYSLKAAALATGTLLTTPYLFMYDMMVLAIPVAFLARIGLAGGFRPYELPALGCALALVVTFVFTGLPVGLGATLIVAGLVLQRAGPWWRREPAPSPMAAAGT